MQAAQAKRSPDPRPAPLISVKREHLPPDTRKFRRLFGPSGACLDLTSPSPAKAAESSTPLTQAMERVLEADVAGGEAAAEAKGLSGGMD